MSDTDDHEPIPSATDGNGNDTPARKRRRRGSRGGRGRGQGNRPQATTSVDKQPEDLPDRPGEGRPSPEVAAAVTTPYRPKIGDTRPAPEPAADAPTSDNGPA